jgi:heterodisulfide reductase subunit C2
LKITKKKNAEGLMAEIAKRMGIDLSVCVQCKKCSSGCPVGELVDSPPSEIMRRLHLGAGDELLQSELIWTCASCETCSARCPMQIDVAAVMDALRVLFQERGATSPAAQSSEFNRAFLDSVHKHGRTYEIGLMTAYKMRTGTFMKDVDKFPRMLAKRKIAILPPRGGDRKTVQRIFKTVRKKKGASS